MTKSNWLNEFKIALIERDEARIGELAANLPDFDDVAQMQEAAGLIRQATKWLQNRQEDLSCEMRELEKTRHFLTYDSRTEGSLDITS